MESDFRDSIVKALLKSVAEYEHKFGVTLEEAIKKQVQKLCENRHPVFDKFDEIDHWEGNCPNCKKTIVSVTTKYCSHCGQAIKWEEE